MTASQAVDSGAIPGEGTALLFSPDSVASTGGNGYFCYPDYDFSFTPEDRTSLAAAGVQIETQSEVINVKATKQLES